jgi:molybdenum cofactor biosynthesis enzyme MoaA
VATGRKGSVKKEGKEFIVEAETEEVSAEALNSAALHIRRVKKKHDQSSVKCVILLVFEMSRTPPSASRCTPSRFSFEGEAQMCLAVRDKILEPEEHIGNRKALCSSALSQLPLDFVPEAE